MTDVPSARAHLRSATREHHERTEASVDLTSRLTSEEAYRDLLRSFLSLFRPLEKRLAALPWQETTLSFQDHRRTPLLVSDLRALGADPDTPDTPPTLPALDSLAAGFGALYVLEGSALGGQIIARQARQSLGLGDETTRFFRSADREVGATWRAFGRALDAYVVTPARLDLATETARETFDAFERCVGPASPVSDA